MMDVEQAFTQLGLTDEADEQAIESAFAQRARGLEGAALSQLEGARARPESLPVAHDACERAAPR